MGTHTPQSVPAAAAAVAAAAAALAAATRAASPTKLKETPKFEELKRKQERALSILEESQQVAGLEADRGKCTFGELETSTSKLEQVVQACRRRPHAVPPDTPDRQSNVGSGTSTFCDSQKIGADLHESCTRLPWECALSPASADGRMALEAEVRSLRIDLINADSRLKAVTAESNQVAAALRRSVDNHQQRVCKLQDEAASLRRENQRLERSLHQAGVEECRVAEAARAQPLHADEALVRLRKECGSLELENKNLAAELQNGRTELACMRGAHPRLESGRSTGSVATLAPSHDSSAWSAPSTTHGGAVRTVSVARCGVNGKGRTITAVDRALLRHGSSPALRRAWT